MGYMLNIIKDYEVKILDIKNGTLMENKLNNFPIYVINLKRDIYRRSYIKHLFKKLKLNYNLVIVNKITQNDLVKWNINQRFRHLGQLGCVLSHMWCLRDAINSNYERFIIFEDDIIFHKRFNEEISKYLSYDLDLLMLGACDFQLKENIVNINNNNDLYFPKENALGAHANLYSLNFAKTLYKHKIENDVIIEFDKDYSLFYNNYKIGICYPNLVVCELSTTNIDHIFSPLKKQFNDYYINRCFMDKLNYSNYDYITIDFIKFVYEKVSLNEFKNYDEVTKLYLDGFTNNLNYKNIREMLLSSDYTLDDLNDIKSIIMIENQTNIS